MYLSSATFSILVDGSAIIIFKKHARVTETFSRMILVRKLASFEMFDRVAENDMISPLKPCIEQTSKICTPNFFLEAKFLRRASWFYISFNCLNLQTVWVDNSNLVVKKCWEEKSYDVFKNLGGNLHIKKASRRPRNSAFFKPKLTRRCVNKCHRLELQFVQCRLAVRSDAFCHQERIVEKFVVEGYGCDVGSRGMQYTVWRHRWTLNTIFVNRTTERWDNASSYINSCWKCLLIHHVRHIERRYHL